MRSRQFWQQTNMRLAEWKGRVVQTAEINYTSNCIIRVAKRSDALNAYKKVETCSESGLNVVVEGWQRLLFHSAGWG